MDILLGKVSVNHLLSLFSILFGVVLPWSCPDEWTFAHGCCSDTASQTRELTGVFSAHQAENTFVRRKSSCMLGLWSDYMDTRRTCFSLSTGKTSCTVLTEKQLYTQVRWLLLSFGDDLNVPEGQKSLSDLLLKGKPSAVTIRSIYISWQHI